MTGYLGMGKPPLESSDVEDNTAADSWEARVSNEPFACCIKQYGVRRKQRGSTAPRKHAVEQEWTRVFALFGTKIRG